MFTLAELEVSVRDILPTSAPSLHASQDDPAAILDIKEDIREECSKLGEVTNVVLFDKELDGVASVRYSNAEAAKACVRVRLTPPLPPSLIHTYVYTTDRCGSSSWTAASSPERR